MLNAKPIPAFTDNYFWLLSADSSPQYAVVDPGQAEPVLRALAEHGGELAAILVTHHHADHVGGIESLVARFPKAVVYGSNDPRIPGVTQTVKAGDRVFVECLGCTFDIFFVPGHTSSHIAWYGDSKLFCGDTMFGCGCGRLFEGTPQQMHDSLSRLRSLPDDTEVYCAHEYTMANIAFAKAVEPENRSLQERYLAARDLRERNIPTVPSTLKTEKETNPFLRFDNPDFVSALGQYAKKTFSSPVSVFACSRSCREAFRG